MTSIYSRAALAAVLSLAAAAPAFAQAEADLDVAATVTENCIVSAGAMDFGDVDVTSGSHFDATAQLTVKCTSGTEWTASADAGLGTGATVASRKMQDGSANLLSYGLFTDAGRATSWGASAGESVGVFTGEGTGANQTKTIYGRVFGGQSSLPAGEYEDTVQVTVSYL